MLNGIKNLLMWIDQNWTALLVIAGLVVMLIQKIKSFMEKTDDEKIEFALNTIKETMLKFVTKAEENYIEWKGAGEIKRAEVIDELYKQYPILSKVADQPSVIKMIDDAIDAALPTLREVIKNNGGEKT